MNTFRIAAASAAVSAVLSAAPARAADAESDFTENCASCHSIGQGELAGPDLKDLSKRRSREWVVRFVSDPDKMFQSGDPVTVALVKKYEGMVMPEVPGMTPERVDGYLRLIEAKSAPAGGVKTAALPAKAEEVVPAPTADARLGEGLFLGARRFKNGGAACVSCHSLGRLPWPGGGRLGPDLSASFKRLGGERGLTSWLSSPASPAMRPLYGARPLAPDEEAALIAFMKERSERAPEEGASSRRAFTHGGGLAALALLAVIGLSGRGRLRPGRGPGRTRSEERDA